MKILKRFKVKIPSYVRLVEIAWIWLIFLIIPLMRILPRLLRKRRESYKQESGPFRESGFNPVSNSPQQKIRTPSKDMQVLGEISIGTKQFEKIRKNTGLPREELDSILQDLERRGLMEVRQKQGIMGLKVELYPTEKGLREFSS